MRAFVVLGLFVTSLSGNTTTGPTSEESLKHKFSQAPDGRFLLKHGATIKAVFGSDHQACVLSVLGPISAKHLVKIFDELVPEEARGAKKSDMTDCSGSCLQMIDYDHVYFTSALIGSQKAEPDGIIVFKRKECEQAAQDAKKAGISITVAH